MTPETRSETIDPHPTPAFGRHGGASHARRVHALAASMRLAFEGAPAPGTDDQILGAACELAAQDGDLEAASLALQNDGCWAMYRVLMAWRAALTEGAQRSAA